MVGAVDPRPFGEVRIRDVEPAEANEIGAIFVDHMFGRLESVTTGRDERSGKERACELGRADGPVIGPTGAHRRFDDVQIREQPERVEFLNRGGEGGYT